MSQDIAITLKNQPHDPLAPGILTFLGGVMIVAFFAIAPPVQQSGTGTRIGAAAFGGGMVVLGLWFVAQVPTSAEIAEDKITVRTMKQTHRRAYATIRSIKFEDFEQNAGLIQAPLTKHIVLDRYRVMLVETDRREFSLKVSGKKELLIREMFARIGQPCT